MQTSRQGRDFIATHEGVVLRAYRCPANVWTIGVGHTARAGGVKPVPGMVITRQQVMDILTDDLRKFDARVTKTGAFKTQHAHDGAASFDFNTGAIDKATWVKRFVAERWAEAEASLMRWVKADGRTMAGLVNRREAEADLIFRGDYGHGGTALNAALPQAPRKPSEDVKEAQKLLTAKGFNPGAVDGWMGRKTKAAVIEFQKAHPHLSNDGILGPATLAQLRRDATAAKQVLKDTTGKGGFGALISGAGSFFLGLPWGWIVAGVIVAAILYFGWPYRDVIMRRINTLLKREVA